VRLRYSQPKGNLLTCLRTGAGSHRRGSASTPRHGSDAGDEPGSRAACRGTARRHVVVPRDRATLEMNPGHEMSEDEARLVQQLENLKVEFGEMLYELRHKLSAAGKVTAGRPRADYSATPTQAQRPHRVRRHRRREYWTAGVRVGPQRQYRQ